MEKYEAKDKLINKGFTEIQAQILIEIMYDSKSYDLDVLKDLWGMKYDKLVLAPGENKTRMREARFVMQAKVAFETRRNGTIMKWATIAIAVATIIQAYNSFFP